MNKLRALAINVALNTPHAEFSQADMQETFRAEIAKLISKDNRTIDYYLWETNKIAVFEILGEMIDTVLPKRLEGPLLRFADVKNFDDGSVARFQLKKGVTNVKRFATKVAAAGVYQRVRLDRSYVDVETYAHGGSVYQTLEGFLSNRENVMDVLDILIQSIEDNIYVDFVTALNGTYDLLPAANKHTHNAFDETEMNRILATVRAYGTPTIFCSQEFASTITPSDSFISETDRLDKRNTGYIGRFNGADVVVLPQSFTDESNTVKIIDPQYAYIFPAGAAEMPIKIAFEGATKIRQVENQDWSTEIQAYKKLGVTVVHTNFYGMYINTSLV